MKIDYTKPNVWGVIASLWQLPQITIAAIVILFSLIFTPRKAFYAYTNKYLTVWELRLNMSHDAPFCFSLGPFIITPFRVTDDTVKHESGHCMQSLFLGPLYLLAVGLPSVVLVLYKRAKNKSADWYHSKYPEKWADNLAGVSRDN